MKWWSRIAPVLVCVAVALISSARVRAAEELVNLATRPGVTQSVWVMTPPSAPVASVILFAGGSGVLGSGRQTVLHSNNFLIRSREKFAAAGFLVASVDAPSDHPEGLDAFRSSAEHAADIAAVIG